MEHERARRLLSDGADSDELRGHLRECPACREHADVLRLVLHHAPALAPPAPATLHDRVLAGTVATAGTTGVRSPSDHAGVVRLAPRRRAPVAIAAAATLVAVVGAGALWSGAANTREAPGQVLAAAVARVHGAGGTSFAFDVSGRATVRLPETELGVDVEADAGAGDRPVPQQPPVPPPPVPPAPAPPPPVPPPPPSVPEAPEWPDGPAALQPPMVQWPRQPGPPDPEQGPPVDVPPVPTPQLEVLEGVTVPDLCDHLPAACTGHVDPAGVPDATGYADALRQLVTALDGVDAPRAIQRLHLDLELDRLGAGAGGGVGLGLGAAGLLDLHYDGTGSSDGVRESAYTLDWRLQEPAAAQGSMEVVTSGDRTWFRTRGSDRWLVTTVAPGFRLAGATAPHDLDDVLDRLASPGAPVRELGPATIRGTPVHGTLVAEGATRIEVWVGRADGLIHRITLEHGTADSAGVEMAVRTVFDLRDHGTEVDVRVPDDGVRLETAPVLELPPFWLDPTADGAVHEQG